MSAGNITKDSAPRSAAAVERMPKVTTTASHTIPMNVAKSAGTMVVCCTANSPPPMPATNAPRAATVTFICTTLTPVVLAPGSLQRTAFMARPEVDRRKFTMNSAMMMKATRHT